MTQKECEKLIAEKLVEIVGIYHQYNPDGKYLSLTYMGGEGSEIWCNNRFWDFSDEGGEIGEDVDRPIIFQQPFNKEG